MNILRSLLCCLLIGYCSSLMGQERKTSVYIFLGPECPISQQCTREVEQLYDVYRLKGIAFYGVVPGVLYSSEEIEEFRATYHISYPIVRDTAYDLTMRLKAVITPQAIVARGHDEIVYSGAIDNSYVALGKKNKYTTAAYLRDALDAVVAGKTVAVKSTTPIGCRIEGSNRHGSRL